MLDNKGVKNRKVNLNIRDVGHRFVRDTMLEGQDSYVVCYDICKQESYLKMAKICESL